MYLFELCQQRKDLFLFEYFLITLKMYLASSELN